MSKMPTGRLHLSPLATQRRRDGRIPQNPENPHRAHIADPMLPNVETFCIRRSNTISGGRTALLNALNSTFLHGRALSRYVAPKSAKIQKIVTGLTLPTPQWPKHERFCIRRREIISSGRTALQNALNTTFLRLSVTEIRCCKFDENRKILTRLTLRTPQWPKGETFCIRRSNIVSRG
jgi:hypothetical protein